MALETWVCSQLFKEAFRQDRMWKAEDTLGKTLTFMGRKEFKEESTNQNL